MEKEIWKAVVGFEGYYEVNNLNKVRSIDRYVEHPRGDLKLKGRILKQQIDRNGYLFVSLCKNGKAKHYFVHRLVAEAFIPNPHNLPMVNHKDENPLINRPENLEWCDVKYNNNYGTRNKRSSESKINGKCSKPVLQYDLQGNFIKEWPSMMEAERNGFNSAHICLSCQNKPNHKTHKGFIWKYK